mgnify:CR=1 FL=1
MIRKFAKYVTQSVAGMIGISIYILADTFFISVCEGANGLAVLNLILPVYGLMYAIGAMIGIGSATRYSIRKAQGQNTALLSYAHVGLRLYFLGFLFAGMNIMLVAYFSAVDRPRPAIVGSLMRGMIAIVVCAIIFASLFGLNGVWLSFLGSEVITFAVILVLECKP